MEIFDQNLARKISARCAVNLRFWLILHLICYQAMADCLVDHCAMEFTRKLRSENVLMGSNLRYCVLIRTYENCLKDTSRGCRGNLKYHTLRTVVATQQKTLNCTGILEGKDITGYILSGESPATSRCLFPYRQPTGRGVGQRLCTLFGDPHLRTFDGQFETCKTAGAWPIVDNSYIGIQVTNDPVPEGARSHATGITR